MPNQGQTMGTGLNGSGERTQALASLEVALEVAHELLAVHVEQGGFDERVLHRLERPGEVLLDAKVHGC